MSSNKKIQPRQMVKRRGLYAEVRASLAQEDSVGHRSDGGVATRMAVAAQIADTEGDALRIPISGIERAGIDIDATRLSLAEELALFAIVQKSLVQAQFEAISMLPTKWPYRGDKFAAKGWHDRKLRILFDCMEVQIPQLRRCRCLAGRVGPSVFPLSQVFPSQMTLAVEYLQVKWVAHLAFTVATQRPMEVVPLGECIYVRGIRPRAQAVGAKFSCEGDGTQATADEATGPALARTQTIAGVASDPSEAYRSTRPVRKPLQ